MAAVPVTYPPTDIDYPTSDGRPMAETELHRDLMIDLIRTLQGWFVHDNMVCVSGNMLVYYEEGNKRRHVAPDVFVVKGVAKRRRDYYLIWAEGKSLDLAIELTSESTREEDIDEKKSLYRDKLKVPEYFLFDPRGEYLKPSLQGFRLVDGDYIAITPVNGRLPSEVLGLHLEANGDELRLWDPATGCWLPTPEEAQAQAELDRQREKDARLAAERERDQQVEARRKLEDEIARLRAKQADGGEK